MALCLVAVGKRSKQDEERNEEDWHQLARSEDRANPLQARVAWWTMSLLGLGGEGEELCAACGECTASARTLAADDGTAGCDALDNLAALVDDALIKHQRVIL